MDLVEFLLARIAEDEAVQRETTPGPWRVEGTGRDERHPHWHHRLYVCALDGPVVIEADGEFCGDLWLAAEPADLEHIARWDPARVLTECDAKRRMVALHPEHGWSHCEGESLPCPTLRLLALPYAGHEDYQQEWAP